MLQAWPCRQPSRLATRAERWMRVSALPVDGRQVIDGYRRGAGLVLCSSGCSALCVSRLMSVSTLWH